MAALANTTETPRLKSEGRDAFQNTPSSISTEVKLIRPDSPASNSKTLVKKNNFVWGFCKLSPSPTAKASLKSSFQRAVLPF